MGVERRESIYSYDRLRDMNKSYYSNYTNLKRQLVSEHDFMILIYDYDKKQNFINMTKTTPVTSIITQEYPIELLKDGEKIKATMRIYVW